MLPPSPDASCGCPDDQDLSGAGGRHARDVERDQVGRSVHGVGPTADDGGGEALLGARQLERQSVALGLTGLCRPVARGGRELPRAPRPSAVA